MDLASYSRWYDYSRARDAMFAATDAPRAPGYLAHSDDRKLTPLSIVTAPSDARSPISPTKAAFTQRRKDAKIFQSVSSAVPFT
jgi:hypothetical protein